MVSSEGAFPFLGLRLLLDEVSVVARPRDSDGVPVLLDIRRELERWFACSSNEGASGGPGGAEELDESSPV